MNDIAAPLATTPSVVAELQTVTNQIVFSAANNAPVLLSAIATLNDVASQLTAGTPLNELNDVINQLNICAVNNVQPWFGLLAELADVTTQLTFGTQTTNPPDVAAIQQLINAILLQEPDWAPLLWINWDGANLTVQVRGIATLVMPVAASPWWTYWPNFPYDASANIIGTIYLMQMSGPPTGFDQQHSSPDITVSPDTLTATRTAQTYPVIPPNGVPPQTALSALSKLAQVYAEVQINGGPKILGAVGISNSLQDLTTAYQAWLGAPGNNSIGYNGDGTVWLNGGVIAAISTFAGGDIIGVAVDCVAQTVQFRNVTQSGAWSPTYNIAALGAAPYRLGVTIYTVGRSDTANFQGPFVGTPLSGFGTWT